MKIAHVFWSFTVGGAETMVVDLINHQINEGNDVFLFIINTQYSENLISTINPFVKVHFLNRKPRSKIPFPLFRLNWLLSLISPDVIHCHNFSLKRVLLNKLLKKSILTVHGFYRPITSKNKFAKVVAISKSVEADLVEKGLVNLSLVYNGIKTDIVEKKEHFNSEIQIVCIGRLDHETKGQHILLEAFSLLKKNGVKAKLHFIGDGTSEGYLKQLTHERNLATEIIFHGSKSRIDLYRMIKDFDILIQPSIHEGFGLTVVEAMVARVPIIISNASGLLEVTNNGKYAQQVVYDMNPVDYCNSIQSIIEQIESLNQSLPEKVLAAENYAIQNFSMDLTSGNYTEIYHRVIYLNKQIPLK